MQRATRSGPVSIVCYSGARLTGAGMVCSHMSRPDSFDPDEPYYERRECRIVSLLYSSAEPVRNVVDRWRTSTARKNNRSDGPSRVAAGLLADYSLDRSPRRVNGPMILASSRLRSCTACASVTSHTAIISSDIPSTLATPIHSPLSHSVASLAVPVPLGESRSPRCRRVVPTTSVSLSV